MRGIQHVDLIILGTETVSCVIRQYADYSMLWYTNFMERIIETLIVAQLIKEPPLFEIGDFVISEVDTELLNNLGSKTGIRCGYVNRHCSVASTESKFNEATWFLSEYKMLMQVEWYLDITH